MDHFMYIITSIWAIGLVRFVVFLALAFVAAKVVSALVTKLLKLVKLDEKFDKWGINEGAAGTSMKFVGKLVYLIVFLSILPSALEAIGIHAIASPISGFVSAFVSYLPNIIAAVILVYVGILVAQILGQIVSVLLKKTKLDSLVSKVAPQDKTPVLLSDILAKIVSSVVILVTIVAALGVLDIAAISGPAISIVNSVFSAIPNIILAVVVVAVGVLVANLACGLLYNVLVAVGFDRVVAKVLPQLKVSATKVVVNTVKTFIILFVAAQGIQALNLSIFTMIAAEIIAYLPLVIKAALILLVAVIGANALEGVLTKACPKAASLGKVLKVAVFTVAGFMILSQLGIAPAIVETAFVVTLSAVAVAFALAFGLGGKDFAKKLLEKAEEKKDCTEE